LGVALPLGLLCLRARLLGCRMPLALEGEGGTLDLQERRVRRSWRAEWIREERGLARLAVAELDEAGFVALDDVVAFREVGGHGPQRQRVVHGPARRRGETTTVDAFAW